MSVGSEKPFRGGLDDAFEAVADEKHVSDVLGSPICEKKVVCDLFRAMRQIEQSRIFCNVFSLFVLVKDCMIQLLQYLLFCWCQHWIEKLDRNSKIRTDY